MNRDAQLFVLNESENVGRTDGRTDGSVHLQRRVENPVGRIVGEPRVGRLRCANERVVLGVGGAVVLERLGSDGHLDPRAYQLAAQELDLVVCVPQPNGRARNQTDKTNVRYR